MAACFYMQHSNFEGGGGGEDSHEGGREDSPSSSRVENNPGCPAGTYAIRLIKDTVVRCGREIYTQTGR